MKPPEKFPHQIGPWKVTGTRQVHETPWLKIREDQIIWPNGKLAGWTVIEMKPAVGIVALTGDMQVHLVGQHRYAVDRYEWEIPEGLVDEGEDLLSAAKRELREETGLTAARWTPLGAIHPHNSSCDSIYHGFLAEELEHGPSQPEETEFLSHKLIPFAEVLEMVHRGDILDAFTIVAIFRAWYHLRGK